MLWDALQVVLGHSYSQLASGSLVHNPLIVLDWTEQAAFSVVTNAFPSVDSFFLIGATLLSYLTLHQLDNRKVNRISFKSLNFDFLFSPLVNLYISHKI